MSHASKIRVLKMEMAAMVEKAETEMGYVLAHAVGTQEFDEAAEELAEMAAATCPQCNGESEYEYTPVDGSYPQILPCPAACNDGRSRGNP